MTLKEHIDDIRDRLEKGEFPNEAAVCDDIVRRLVHELGWPRFQSQIVYPQYPVEGGKVDFALCHPPSEPCVFIEVKQVGNIEGAEEQLFKYAFHRGIPIAVLTDGRKWQFFHPTGKGTWTERKVCEFDIIIGDSEENAKWLNRYLNYESIRTGKAVETIKKDYEKIVQQRQLATAWSKLVEGADELLVHPVRKKIEDMYGYRPTNEQVLDFLKSLKQEIKPFPPPNGGRKRRRRSRRHLVVTIPNGEKIDHNVAAATFAEVIEKLGIERVKNLERIVSGISLISTSKHPKYDQRKSRQYYIMTNIDTKIKKRLLEEIASELGEPLKVEIVEEP